MNAQGGHKNYKLPVNKAIGGLHFKSNLQYRSPRGQVLFLDDPRGQFWSPWSWS